MMKLHFARGLVCGIVLLAAPAAAWAQDKAAMVAAIQSLTQQLNAYDRTSENSVSAELAELAAAIDAYQTAIDPKDYFIDRAAAVSGLLKLLAFRSDDTLETAVESLESALFDYNNADTAGHFAKLTDAVEKLVAADSPALPPTSTGVRDSLLDLIAYRADFETQFPAEFLNSRTAALAGLVLGAVPQVPEGQPAPTAHETLAPVLAKLDRRSALERLQADIGNLKTVVELPEIAPELRAELSAFAPEYLIGLAAFDSSLAITLIDNFTSTSLSGLMTGGALSPGDRDKLLALRDLIGGKLDPPAPRIRVTYAGYGDFRNSAAASARCNATHAIQKLCDGKQSCTLRGDLQNLTCGVDPAVTTPDDIKKFVATYRCYSLDEATWGRVIAGTEPPPAGAGEISVNTRLPNPVLRCTPRFTEPDFGVYPQEIALRAALDDIETLIGRSEVKVEDIDSAVSSAKAVLDQIGSDLKAGLTSQ